MTGQLKERFSVEQRRELISLAKLRGFINREDPAFLGAQKVIFQEMFPLQTKEPEKYLFSVDKISQHPEVEYTVGEKKVARLILSDFGWAKAKEDEKQSNYDMPHLFIAYNENPTAITTQLNHLEFMKRQDAIGMADMTLQNGETGIYKMTRGQHVRHMASLVFRDVLRAAIKTPDLLIERIQEDLKRYGLQDAAFLEGKNNGAIERAQSVSGEDLSGSQRAALQLGLEYAKYLIVFAYIHDERTPAWGDVIMKASARFEGQRSINYSEDTNLIDEIDAMIGIDEQAGDDDTGLSQMLDTFHLNKKFLSQLVKSFSSEGDSCLGGILMKNKRKALFEDQNPDLAVKLREINATYSKKNEEDKAKLGAVFDEDQTSGTIANLYDLAAQIMPGGFKNIPKKGETGEFDENKLPIGSFYERLELLAYALSTGKNKADIIKYCNEKGIDSDRLYIARDEFHIGANFELRRVEELGGEILPVGVDPGSIKRLMYAFATLTYFHYQSDRRSGLERLLQDIITAIHEKQFLSQQSDDSYIGNPENTQILDIFRNTTDEGASADLRGTVPVLSYIKNRLINQVSRLTPKEVPRYLEEVKSRGNFYLLSEAQIFPVDRKPGTLTLNDQREVKPYLDVVAKKRDTGERHEDSLPNVLRNVEAKIKESSYYHVIELTPADITEIQRKIEVTQPPAMQEILKRALRYWTLDLTVGNTIIHNEAMRQNFLLADENGALPLNEQRETSTDLFFLMASQYKINK